MARKWSGATQEPRAETVHEEEYSRNREEGWCLESGVGRLGEDLTYLRLPVQPQTSDSMPPRFTQISASSYDSKQIRQVFPLSPKHPSLPSSCPSSLTVPRDALTPASRSPIPPPQPLRPTIFIGNYLHDPATALDTQCSCRATDIPPHSALKRMGFPKACFVPQKCLSDPYGFLAELFWTNRIRSDRNTHSKLASDQRLSCPAPWNERQPFLSFQSPLVVHLFQLDNLFAQAVPVKHVFRRRGLRWVPRRLPWGYAWRHARGQRGR